MHRLKGQIEKEGLEGEGIEWKLVEHEVLSAEVTAAKVDLIYQQCRWPVLISSTTSTSYLCT